MTGTRITINLKMTMTRRDDQPLGMWHCVLSNGPDGVMDWTAQSLQEAVEKILGVLLTEAASRPIMPSDIIRIEQVTTDADVALK